MLHVTHEDYLSELQVQYKVLLKIAYIFKQTQLL